MKSYMIASDIDGTLLPPGSTHFNEEIFETIRRCIRAGVHFVACSGRDYSSLRHIFEPVMYEMYFISTNGGQIIHHDRIVAQTNLDKSLALEIIQDIESNEELEVLVSVRDKCYVKNRILAQAQEFADYKTQLEGIDDFTAIPEEIIKIAAYCASDIDVHFRHLYERWHERTKVVTSGDEWIDFMEADKGTALRNLAESLGVERENVFAFGDQHNDVPMLEWAGHPHIMKHSSEALQRDTFAKSGDVAASIREILDQLAAEGEIEA